MDVNRLETFAELAKVFADYEAALAAGDNERLAALFWPDPALVRFGLGDRQAGHAEDTAWRMAQPAPPPGRRLLDTVVTTFGDAFAVVTTLFEDGDTRVGRQSQTWVRLGEGWRIVNAHVSWSPEPPTSW